MAKNTSNLQIDAARLWDTIHETAAFGRTPKGGVRRLTLGPEDKQVRDWFRDACEAAGCEVHIDALGTMFENRDLPVLNNYRALLGGVMQRMWGLSSTQLELVFPAALPQDVGLV